MFPFLHDYPYSDLHEIDLAYLYMLVRALESDDKKLLAWKSSHEKEYAELANKVEGLIDNLIDVIVPWDSSVAYRVFSIVEYQGTNYIAVQDVPVGTMITNTEYWQPANTIVEQINAIAVQVDEIEEKKVSADDISLGVQRPAMICARMERGNVRIRDFAGSDNFDAGFTSMQSGCYIPELNRIIIAVIKGSTGEAILAVTDTDYNVIRRVGPLPIGHVNDMTYNPNTNTIFITTGYDGNYPGHIVELDLNLTIVNTYDIGVSNWCISYDEVHDKYYVIADEGLYRYNSDFTLDAQLPYDLNYVGDGTIHIQGSYFMNDIFYVMTFLEYADVSGYTGANIIGIDNEGTVITSMYYSLSDPSDEPELLYVKDDKIHILAGQSWFREYIMPVDHKFTMENFVNNRSSKTLENGTDLNTLMIPGKYQTVNSAGTASLLNEPTRGYSAISIDVEIVQWFSVKQTVTATYNNVWTRVYDTPTDTWGAWEKESIRTLLATENVQTELQSGTSTSVYSLSIPAKKCAIIEVTASFPTNATGRRMLSIDGIWKQSVNAVTGDPTRLSTTAMIENNSSAARNAPIRVYQNSGEALTVDTTINYIFI